MKRLVAVLSIILFLSFPVLAGHTQYGGGFIACQCTPIDGVCPCCGFSGLTAEPDQENVTVNQNPVSESEQTTSEWDLALTVFLTLLRVTA